MAVPVAFGKKTEWKDGKNVETDEDNIITLWAFNARVSLTLSVCHRPQAATLALRSGAVRSPVTVVPSCGLETRSWRTGRMARHKQECIRLPYTAALASQRAFFVKVLSPATKERNRERVSCFRFQTGLVSSC